MLTSERMRLVCPDEIRNKRVAPTQRPTSRALPPHTAGKRSARRLGAAVSMGVPSFYAWVKKRYPLMVEHVHHRCSDSPDGQAGADSVS